MVKIQNTNSSGQKNKKTDKKTEITYLVVKPVRVVVDCCVVVQTKDDKNNKQYKEKDMLQYQKDQRNKYITNCEIRKFLKKTQQNKTK